MPQSQRPIIPEPVQPGDPVRADQFNALVDLAGYFEDFPIDQIIPGESIYVGRPSLMQVSSTKYPSTSETPAWDGPAGRIYGVQNAMVTLGSTGAYSAGAYSDDEYPGLCISEIYGGNSASLGDIVMAFPLQTPSGLVFIFQASSSSTLYRVDSPVVIIADRKWSYNLVPQVVDADGVTWSDDPYGTTLEGAMNEAEALNSAGDTLQGNDVDFADEPFTSGVIAKKLKAIQENRMVEITRWTTNTTGSGSGSGAGTRIPWFNAPNIVQEACA